MLVLTVFPWEQVVRKTRRHIQLDNFMSHIVCLADMALTGSDVSSTRSYFQISRANSRSTFVFTMKDVLCVRARARVCVWCGVVWCGVCVCVCVCVCLCVCVCVYNTAMLLKERETEGRWGWGWG